MSENKFKVGDKVRVVSLITADDGAVNVCETGTVRKLYEEISTPGYYIDFGRDIDRRGWTIVDGAYLMWEDQLELVPFEVPASPFYVRATPYGECEYKIDVDGLTYSMASIESGEVFGPKWSETRNIPSLFERGIWILIDPPTPAVDPVAALTARVQQLLREKAEASSIVDSAHNALNAAQEKQRDIGKLLVEAQRALDKSMHEAAGVKWDSIKHGPMREIAEILAYVR